MDEATPIHSHDSNPSICACIEKQEPNQANISNFITLPVSMNGFEILCHLDTGSQVTLINENCAKLLNLPVVKSSLSLRQAEEGIALRILGCILNVPFEFNGIVFNHDVQIVPLNKNFNCLLGLDVFRKLNLYIGGFINNQFDETSNMQVNEMEDIPCNY